MNATNHKDYIVTRPKGNTVGVRVIRNGSSHCTFQFYDIGRHGASSMYMSISRPAAGLTDHQVISNYFTDVEHLQCTDFNQDDTSALKAVEIDPTGKDPHTPGAKLDAGKVRVDLVFNGMAKALVEVSRVATFGAQKYTEHGWIDVPNGILRYTAAMDRHRLAEVSEPNDPDSQIYHAAHLAWNALARLELILRGY